MNGTLIPTTETGSLDALPAMVGTAGWATKIVATQSVTPKFTIILPHRRNPGNDRALKIALECLFTNTQNDFHLLIDAAEDQPLYPRINRLVEQSRTDCVVYWSSDMFPAPGWDQPMLDLWDERTIVTNVLVEPGVIGVHPNNVHCDFGRTPETFRRAEFEEWAKAGPVPSGHWFAPWMLSRSRFLELGGMPENLQGDDLGFTPGDVVFFEKWLTTGGTVKRARGFAYHLQRWSQIEEQEAGKRR